MIKLRDAQLAVAAMVTIAILWGSSAVVTKGLLTTIPAADLLAVRFLIATTALAVVWPRALRMSRRTLRDGVVMGGLFAAAQLTQTIALGHTSASVSGFLTGLYVVATPLLSWALFRHRVGAGVWVGVTLAMAGLAAFALLPAAGSGGSRGGEALTVVSALLFAAHLIATGRRVTAETSLSLTIVQSAVVAVASLVMAAPGGITLPHGVQWVSTGYIAIVCGALCLFLQIWAQAHVDATRAAVVMCSEPLWVAVFAICLGGEVMTLQVLLGGVAIVGAMVAAVLPDRLFAVLGNRARGIASTTR